VHNNIYSSKQNKYNYIFDLDNTLIYTDALNNLAYNYALSCFGLNSIKDTQRITREIIRNKYPHLSQLEIDNISQLKQDYFKQNLIKTNCNKSLVKFLRQQDPNQCMLWTSADKNRTLELLKYYQLNHHFTGVLFSPKENIDEDIQKLTANLNCANDELIIFDDNELVINELPKLGVNIIAT
jgi:phosphoglycolate phosphatase-like HAD superfamily hydrolase